MTAFRQKKPRVFPRVGTDGTISSRRDADKPIHLARTAPFAAGFGMTGVDRGSSAHGFDDLER
jgi:hypothetical protein